MAQPQNMSSLCCLIKCWRVLGYLWFFMDGPRPGILDIWPSVSMVCHLCQFPFPRQLGKKKTYLIPRQDQSTAKLWVCSRDDRQVVPDGKREPITCLVRVCSHSSSSAFCYSLRIIFFFFFCLLSQAQEENPWWVNELPSILNDLSCVSH